MARKKKLLIFVVAFRAAKTLVSVIERIPKSVINQASEIAIFDDCSDDNTYYIGLGYKYSKNFKKLKVYHNVKNLGYGGNQKEGYNYAIKNGFDIVVMLHGDAQYSPEKIPELIAPLYSDSADAVFGSRMLGKNPLRQGMPLWKYIGNKFLTFIENKALGLNLSEYHSGFRAYSTAALKKLPFLRFSNNYHFDTEIIVALREANMHIKEIPTPTHYGPESHQISLFKSLKYGFEIIKLMLGYIFIKKNSHEADK